MSNLTTNGFNATFTPTSAEIWTFYVQANDTGGGATNSSMTNITVELDWNWTIVPSSLGTTAVIAGNTAQLGNLTINNTADYTLTFDLKALNTISGNLWTRIAYNETEPITLSANTEQTIAVSSTTDSNWLAGDFNITLQVNATNASAYPEHTNATAVLRISTTTLAPVLEVSIDEYDATPTRGETNVSYKVKVTNTGTLAATNVYLNWTVPSGWTINEGDFNTTIASLGVDKTSWNNITVDIGSSAATGSVTISAESNSTEAVYASDSKSVDVAAAAVVAGAGAVGGGGGGGVGGGGKATVSFKTIEIVRGEEDSFDIEVYNRAKDKILEHVVVDVTGFLSQYITISPEEIRRINPGDRKNFTVKINVPAYTEDAEEYDLKILINGELTSVGADLREQYRETQNIKLIILEVSDERVGLSDAERAVEEMRDAGFCVTNVEVLLEQARENLEERNNKGAQDLVREIVAIRDMAFSTEDLMGKILEALENPRKMNLITGNVAREVIDEDGEMVSVNSIIMGNAIFDSKDAEEVLELARVAFDRCDYDLAEERAKSAQVLLILERKGNLPLFIYLNWWAILLGIGAFSTAGIVGYRRYQKSAVTKRIDSINKKEENVRRLIVGAQRSYFSGKISAGVYHGRMRNHQRELARLRKVRLRLRNKRIKIYEASSDFPGVGS